jgi:glycosyltransferase involved in cell wall biosynthesis
MAHALHIVLDAAARLQDRPEILFAFVGEGAEKKNLKAQAAQLGLRNVQFIDHQPKQRVPLFYSACDLGLVTLRNARLFQSTLPSKIFEYLGMARPILVSVDGDARNIVEKAQAGWYVPAEDSLALCDGILKAFRCQDDLRRMGALGRDYILQYYDRKILAAEYLRILAEIKPRRH